MLLLAERNDLQGKHAGLRSARLKAHRLRKIGTANVVDEGGPAHEVHDRLPAVLLGVKRQVIARRVVAPTHPIFAIQHDNAVRQRLRAPARTNDQSR